MSHSAEHPFANPGPAGLMVLAFYLACLWPVAVGMAPHEMAVVLVPLGLAGGIVQLTAGIICLRNHEIMNGNILMAFSAFMFLGLGENLLKALHIMPANTMAVDGWIFLVMGIFMCGFTVGHLTAPRAAFFFMVFTDIFFINAALYFLTRNTFFWYIASWDLPFVVVSIMWLVFGVVLNTHFGRTVVPLGKPFR
jgi:succinate-acetate transporter protein